MKPPKNKLIYLAPARGDLLDIARYHLENVGVSSAREITEKIENTINRLTLFPLMGQIHPDHVLAESGYRKVVVTSTYVCVYKVIDEVIYIYRIVNAKTDYPKLLR